MRCWSCGTMLENKTKHNPAHRLLGLWLIKMCSQNAASGKPLYSATLVSKWYFKCWHQNMSAAVQGEHHSTEAQAGCERHWLWKIGWKGRKVWIILGTQQLLIKDDIWATLWHCLSVPLSMSCRVSVLILWEADPKVRACLLHKANMFLILRWLKGDAHSGFNWLKLVLTVMIFNIWEVRL